MTVTAPRTRSGGGRRRANSNYDATWCVHDGEYDADDKHEHDCRQRRFASGETAIHSGTQSGGLASCVSARP